MNYEQDFFGIDQDLSFLPNGLVDFLLEQIKGTKGSTNAQTKVLVIVCWKDVSHICEPFELLSPPINPWKEIAKK